MMPAISQWPVVVSLPFERSAQRPKDARGLSTGATPLKLRTLPNPQPRKLGIFTCRDSQMCPSVSEPASPHSAASGISPMPRLSSTMSVIRSNARPSFVILNQSSSRYLIELPASQLRGAW